MYKGVDPLTPEDIAEVVVFTAGRKENVVIADTLVYPNHQVSVRKSIDGIRLTTVQAAATVMHRRS